MATVYGVNFTKTRNTPRDYVEVAEWGGRMRVQYDTYEASSVASGSTISIAKLPKDARVWRVTVYCDALGSSSTLAVGDSGSATRYLAAVSSASAAKLEMPAASIAGFGYKQTAETDVIVTTGGASITGTIKTAVWYTVD